MPTVHTSAAATAAEATSAGVAGGEAAAAIRRWPGCSAAASETAEITCGRLRVTTATRGCSCLLTMWWEASCLWPAVRACVRLRPCVPNIVDAIYQTYGTASLCDKRDERVRFILGPKGHDAIKLCWKQHFSGGGIQYSMSRVSWEFPVAKKLMWCHPVVLSMYICSQRSVSWQWLASFWWRKNRGIAMQISKPTRCRCSYTKCCFFRCQHKTVLLRESLVLSIPMLYPVMN